MTCPNCEMPVMRGSLCTRCGTDSVILTKTIQLSSIMYNKGLAAVKSGNLSSAIESLSKSVSYNKDNTASRNLLGLVYFRCGKVADACKHWVISAHLVKKDNPANKYLNALQENMDILERYGEAIEKYNAALAYMLLRNDDMAIIQLRRAIELNPNLVDALNLMAFCCLMSKDNRELAAEPIERVLAIDAGNLIALNYYKRLNPVRSRYEIKNQITRQQQSPARRAPVEVPYLYVKPKRTFSPFHLVSLLLFVVGAVCTYTFMAAFVVPYMLEDAESQVTTLGTQLTEYTQATEARLSELESENERLSILANEATGDRDTLSTNLIREQKVNKVNEAYNYLLDGKIEEAADALYQLDATGLPQATAELYDDMISNTVFPVAAQTLRTSGMQEYNTGDYSEAKLLLEKALRYAQNGTAAKADVIYYLGLTSQALDEYSAAMEYFRDITDNYPNAAPNVRETAQNRLNALLEQQGNN